MQGNFICYFKIVLYMTVVSCIAFYLRGILQAFKSWRFKTRFAQLGQT